MGEKLGIMICGHGSRNKMAADQFSSLAVGLKKLMPEHPVEYGYLEFANPVISHGLDSLREQGVTRVLAVPGMLFAAGHAKTTFLPCSTPMRPSMRASPLSMARSWALTRK